MGLHVSMQEQLFHNFVLIVSKRLEDDKTTSKIAIKYMRKKTWLPAAWLKNLLKGFEYTKEKMELKISCIYSFY